MNNYTNNQIKKYLLDLKVDRDNIKEYNSKNLIKKKNPNISEDATESLAYNLISDGIILSNDFKDGIYNIKRDGKKGKDIVINYSYVVEIKGTSSKEGFITTSKKNFKSYAWVWFNLRRFFCGENIITVNVIKKPNECLNPYKIQANGESKLSLKKAMVVAKKLGCHESIDINIDNFEIKNINGNKFFN